GTGARRTEAPRAECRAATAPRRDGYAARYPGAGLRRVDEAVAACESRSTPAAAAASPGAPPIDPST
ncbi:MAG: hypothetical protein ACK5F5_12355, partial [Gammaproteobacteria bacterium]